MAGTPHRQRILGDSDESSPDNWRWGGPGTPEPHVLLMLYARDEIALSELLLASNSHASRALDSPRSRSSRRTGCLRTRSILVFATASARRASKDFTATPSPANTIAAGEFVLGYLNAYGQYTQRPLVDQSRDPNGLLPQRPGGLHSGRSRDERQLPGLSSTQSGRDELLAVLRRADATSATARRTPRRADAAGREDGGTLAGRCAAREVAGEGRSGVQQRERFPVSLGRRCAGPEVSDRRAHPPDQPARLARAGSRAPTDRSRSGNVTASSDADAPTAHRS